MALVIDFQEKLMPVMDKAEALEARTGILLKGLRTLEVQMLFTQQLSLIHI